MYIIQSAHRGFPRDLIKLFLPDWSGPGLRYVLDGVWIAGGVWAAAIFVGLKGRKSLLVVVKYLFREFLSDSWVD